MLSFETYTIWKDRLIGSFLWKMQIVNTSGLRDINLQFLGHQIKNYENYPILSLRLIFVQKLREKKKEKENSGNALRISISWIELSILAPQLLLNWHFDLIKTALFFLDCNVASFPVLHNRSRHTIPNSQF